MMNYIGAGIQPLYKCQQTSGYVRFAGGAPSQRGADNICSGTYVGFVYTLYTYTKRIVK